VNRRATINNDSAKLISTHKKKDFLGTTKKEKGEMIVEVVI
jgi:hypothetical protein